jgi:hypothetical protein
MTAAVVGAGVVGILVAVYWATVRDHVEGWQFQVSTKTETLLPKPVMRGVPTVLAGRAYNEKKYSRFKLEDLLSLLGNHSGSPVVYDPADPIWGKSSLPPGAWWTDAPPKSTRRFYLQPTEIRGATDELAMRILRANGWRVIEQRLPRRAYILRRGEPARLDPVTSRGIITRRAQPQEAAPAGEAETAE